MRFTQVLVVAAVSLSAFAFGCAETADDDAEQPVGEPTSEESELVRRSVMIDADDNGKTVSVNSNQKFTIKLAQNSASSGYRWSVKSAGGFGEAERRTVGPTGGRIGGSGWDYFSWNVGDKTGSHVVELAYARGPGTPAQRFKATIDIKTAAMSGKCGGLAGLRCTGGEYCKFTGSVCGRFDQMGRCEARPAGCRMHNEPVCGCNYRTYSNSCLAKTAGVDVAAEGPCAE